MHSGCCAAITGAIVIGAPSDGLVMMIVSEFWQTVIKGLVIIAAVVLDQRQRRLAADASRRYAPEQGHGKADAGNEGRDAWFRPRVIGEGPWAQGAGT